MNGVVAAPLQFIANRSFAGAGNAIDKIISFAHCSSRGFINQRARCQTYANLVTGKATTDDRRLLQLLQLDVFRNDPPGTAQTGNTF